MLIADDFEAFQHVMTKRNLLIQEQVLLLIIASTGYHPDSLKPLTEAPSGGDVASRLSAHDNNEQEVLNAIMRFLLDSPIITITTCFKKKYP